MAGPISQPLDEAPPGGDAGQPILADESRRPEAVAALLGSEDPEDGRRFLDFARENHVDLSGLWSAPDDAGRPRASVLIVPSAGRTAMVFATPCRRREDLAPRAALVRHACAQLPRLGHALGPTALAQALLDVSADLDREALLASGFRFLAYLSYLERPLPGPAPRLEPWPAGARVEPYAPARREDLLRILQESYEDTLDCPGLRGLRRTEDILSGHMATGRFDPDLWSLLYLDERPAGALLLNPSAHGRSIELVYLGLAPFARGRGHGRGLLRHGLSQIRRRPERTVALAVDENNAPALRLYRAEGFRRVLRRAALIFPLNGD
jgi:ribosomal protein S18 acetylase RimI-like enzyme